MLNEQEKIRMENLDFITTPQYTKEDVKRAQARLLEMAKLVCRTLPDPGEEPF